MIPISLQQAARNMLVQSLNVKPGETLLIVSDGTREEICRELYVAGTTLGAEAIVMEMQPLQRSGQEPPKLVALAMQQADAVICPTEHSLTHTRARKKATDNGSRVATMPGITLDMFENGPMTADYTEVAALSRKVADILSNGTIVRVEKDEAVFECSLEGRNGIASTGVYTDKGQSGNLPSGEAYIAPLEGRSNGEIVVDGSIVGLGLLTSPIRLTVQDGLLVGATGDRADEWLGKLGDSKEARNVAELGIGTNDKARLTGVILEDEKAWGTIHVAFGSNATFGGTVEAGVHLDAVIMRPTVYVDDKLLMQAGKLMVE